MDKDARQIFFDKMDFIPSKEQLSIIDDPSRYKLVAGGVRAGKSRLASVYLVNKILESFSKGTAKPGDVYWLVAADYERTRAEFTYISQDLAKLSLLGDVTKPINPGTITISGYNPPILIKTKSASDYKTLAMESPKGIIACEASQIDLESFWRLQERLVESRGWLLLEGTFESSLGWYPERFTAWQSPAIQKTESSKSFSLPTWSNLALFPEGEDDPEIGKMLRDHSDSWYKERIAGIPAPPKGRVHEMFRNEIHIQDVDYVDDYPVYIWIDPGYSRATESAYAVMFAQVINGQVNIFDEIYEQEKIGPEIVDMAMMKSWWGFADKRGAIDVAGTQHQAMPSQTEVWLEKTGLYLEPIRVRITDGIERFNTFLKVDPISGDPNMVINPRCTGLISELGGGPNPFTGRAQVYSWAMDKEGNVLGQTPRDRYNHAVKAVTYGLISEFGYARGPFEIEREAEVSYWT